MSFFLALLTLFFPGPELQALAGGLFWGGWFSSPPCSTHSLFDSFLLEVLVMVWSSATSFLETPVRIGPLVLRCLRAGLVPEPRYA